MLLRKFCISKVFTMYAEDGARTAYYEQLFQTSATIVRFLPLLLARYNA